MGEYYEEPNIYQLICKYDNEEQVYTFNSEQYPNCYQDPGAYITENRNENILIVYPNPSTNQVKVKILNSEFNDLQACFIY